MFIAVVIGLSVLLPIMAFRSLWIPLVSARLDLLSVGRCVRRRGRRLPDRFGASVLGVDSGVPIVSFVPVMLFAILFGLSMDYNVFLLSRIHGAYNEGDGPRESVIHGMARIGKVVLFAGLIMSAVFLAFIATPDVISKIMGLGLGLAILIDVLIVRLLISPAVVTLLGDKAWWLPAWMKAAAQRLARGPPRRGDGPAGASSRRARASKGAWPLQVRGTPVRSASLWRRDWATATRRVARSTAKTVPGCSRTRSSPSAIVCTEVARMLRALIVAVALSLTVASAAWADGDPAGDVLIQQNVFYGSRARSPFEGSGAVDGADRAGQGEGLRDPRRGAHGAGGSRRDRVPVGRPDELRRLSDRRDPVGAIASGRWS